MRNKRTLRYGLTSLTIIGAALGAALVACGDDDDNNAPTPTPVADGGPGTDTGAPARDAGGDATPDAAPRPQPARLQLVNAAYALGPANPGAGLRVCYGIGATEATATIAGLPPLPDTKSAAEQPFPGVFPGTGGNVQGTGVDLSAIVVVPYIMNAATLGTRGLVKPPTAGDPGVSCANMLDPTKDAGGVLTPGVDYWKLPAIPANTLVSEKSFVLILTGCSGNAASGAAPNLTVGTARCGADYAADTGDQNSNGNLKITVHELDRGLTVAADKIGTQFIHASPSGASFLATVNPVGPVPVIPGYITDPDAGGGANGFKGVTGGAAIALNTKSALVEVAAVNPATDFFTASQSVPALSISLPNVAALTYGAAQPDGGAFQNGKAVTFIAVGDAYPDAGASPTVRFHYIALPNNPDIVNYDFTK